MFYAQKLSPAVIHLLFLLIKTSIVAVILPSNVLYADRFSPESKTGSACSAPDTLIKQLLGWIESHTDYDTSVTRYRPPLISFCKIGDTIPYEDGSVSIDVKLKGAYDYLNRTIYLVAPWDSSNIYHQSVLLHDLIHDVQHTNRRWNCIQAPEWEAYKLQDEWLSEHGIESGFDWLKIHFLAKCPLDIHP